MKSHILMFFSLLAFTFSVAADWVIVKDVESGGPTMQMTNRITFKIKGNKARIDSGPFQSTISDNDSGDQIILMHLQKQYVVQSASQRKESMEFVKKMMPGAGEKSTQRPELRATGKKEKISGYDTEQYIWEGPLGKGIYWVARDFPNDAAILGSMESSFSDARGLAKGMFPETKDLRGMPIRTELEQVTIGPPGLTPGQLRQSGLEKGQTMKSVTTLISAKEETLTASAFPVLLSQTVAIWSALVVRMREPSGENVTEKKKAFRGAKEEMRFLVSKPHTSTRFFCPP